ncbi:MAG: hypothetical protein GTO62_12175, partial [Planctomycetales bacterium]|nr:hypothetical protein [Planctomycetales bacterium]NIP70000.1 hypothetical protein [Planctomycetales bacterium]
NGRAGWTDDDRLAGTHLRVKSWYAGTTDLTLPDFTDSFPDPPLLDGGTNPIWRKLTDRIVEKYDDNGESWYRAREG